MKDYTAIAASLYDGGWRAEDREQLVSEYNLTAEEAEEICKLLEDMKYDAIKEDLYPYGWLTTEEYISFKKMLDRK